MNNISKNFILFYKYQQSIFFLSRSKIHHDQLVISQWEHNNTLITPFSTVNFPAAMVAPPAKKLEC
jgi:hypothetical protein